MRRITFLIGGTSRRVALKYLLPAGRSTARCERSDGKFPKQASEGYLREGGKVERFLTKHPMPFSQPCKPNCWCFLIDDEEDDDDDECKGSIQEEIDSGLGSVRDPDGGRCN